MLTTKILGAISLLAGITSLVLVFMQQWAEWQVWD